MAWNDDFAAGVGSGADKFTALKDGVNAATTCSHGSTDPSAAWSGDLSRFAGRFWSRTSSPHSTTNPGLYRWELLTSPSTYGWRFLGILGFRRFDTDANRAVTFSPASPATGDVAFTDVSFDSQLDTERTAQGLSLEKTAYAVLLRVRVEEAGTIPTGSGNEDKAVLKLRRKGDTGEGQRFLAQVSGRAVERDAMVFLDGSEVAQFRVQVGTGTPSLKYQAWVEGWWELL